MGEILSFNSGAKINLIDGRLHLAYGKRDGGVFLVSFDEIFKNIYLNEDTFFDRMLIEDSMFKIERIKDYDGEVLKDVDKIESNRKVGNVYSVTFDSFESLIILAVASAIGG